MAGLPVKPYPERNANDQSEHDPYNQSNQTCNVWQIYPVVGVQPS
jgi:hypothetical protein